jgi:predicted acyltransferase
MDSFPLPRSSQTCIVFLRAAIFVSVEIAFLPKIARQFSELQRASDSHLRRMFIKIALKGQAMKSPINQESMTRLTSLDVLRGLAIAGMILVNNPGSWEHVYSPLLHAQWSGCTPTDLVFPCFLFVVGASMALSYSRRKLETQSHGPFYTHVLRRAALLFALGILLNASSLVFDWLFNNVHPDFSTLRIMGVLQRISIAYLLASLAVLSLPPSGQWTVAAVLLLGYWAIMEWGNVPGFVPGDLSMEGNYAAHVDRLILTPAHMYRGGPYDPEGLVGSFPAAATVLAGYLAGDWLRSRPVISQTSFHMALAAVNFILLGYYWNFVFPINKALWTSSYVVFTAGWSLLLLSICFDTVEVREWRWGRPLEAMGRNAILLFVGSGIVARILYKTHVGASPNSPNTYTWIYETLFLPWGSPKNGSLAFAVTNLLLWWLALWSLYKRRWFIKL